MKAESQSIDITEPLSKILSYKESESLEFKEAKYSFNMDSLLSYCCAISNEGGGKLILGVTDKAPRVVVGTEAFRESKLDQVKLRVVKELGIRLDVSEDFSYGPRVLIFNIPPRPIGKAVSFQGRYLMRAGESLVDMTDDTIKDIFSENIIDYSAEINKKLV